MSKIKVAVIGTGHLGSIHTRLWAECDEAELSGIYDINKENARKIANEHQIKSFESIDETIDLVDAVTIAAPTTEHFSIAAKCLEMGKHCFIEKPITSKYDEAKQLINIANKNNLLVQVGHVERFNPAIAALKDYPLSPVFIEAHRLSQFKPRAIDVSVIHDLMIHDIDIVQWLVKSKVSKIDANGVAVITETTDIANARLTFENGAVANLTASRISARPLRKMRLFQKDAYISIDFANRDVEVYRLLDDNEDIENKGVPATMLGSIDAGTRNRNIVFEKPQAPDINAIAEEQHAFVSAIKNGEPAIVGVQEAAEALRIAEEISQMVND